MKNRARSPRRQAGRMLLRAIAVIVGLIIIAGAAFGVLLLRTPSAGAAASLVKAEAAKNGIGYPGPTPPRRFVEALVATEDHRFYSPFDPGVDPLAVARVLLARITGEPDQGGSTIEQQLAKMLYTPGQSGLSVELEQLVLAIKLNFTYSKARILSMYAEVAYYGHGYYGLEAASCGYFAERPVDLTWAQAAMLAGVVNAPTADDPLQHPGRARAREIHVLARLVAVRDLSAAEAKAALAHPVGLAPRRRGARPPACRVNADRAHRASGKD